MYFECDFVGVIIKGDALAVINLFLSKDYNHAPYGHIIENAKQLPYQLQECSWSFAWCSNNKGGYCLAKFVKYIIDCLTWKNEAPYFLLPSFKTDSPYSNFIL